MNGVKDDELHTIERVIASPDEDAIGGTATYCIGCGSCAVIDPAFRIAKNADGCYRASVVGEPRDWIAAERVCPFASSVDENQLGEELFSKQSGVKYDQHLGYYLSAYAGYVSVDGWRSRGTSGGMISWLAAKMLQDGLVDAVIHAKDGPDPKNMYTIQISRTVDEIKAGAKAKYYPIELSEAIKQVREHEGRYLFIGLPCFVKAVRLLRREDPVLMKRIPYCIGLICGHLKSDFFGQAEAWESGVPLDKIARVDFRHKTSGTRASDYAIEVRRTDKDEPIVKRIAELSTANWGLGYFKYNACDYCDDVLAETADATFGDAWIPKYVSDDKGCNVIIIRNQAIQDLFNRYRNELVLHDSDATEVYQSQSSGFRHRRQGLAERLYIHQQRGEWTPTKRIKPSLDGIPERRQRVYAMRTILKNESFVAFREAVKAGDFTVFNKHMKPLERKYWRVSIPFRKRMMNLVKRAINKLGQILKKL